MTWLFTLVVSRSRPSVSAISTWHMIPSTRMATSKCSPSSRTSMFALSTIPLAIPMVSFSPPNSPRYDILHSHVSTVDHNITAQCIAIINWADTLPKYMQYCVIAATHPVERHTSSARSSASNLITQRGMRPISCWCHALIMHWTWHVFNQYPSVL